MEEFRVQPPSSSSTTSSSAFSLWIPPEEAAQAPACPPDREHLFNKVVTPSDVGKLNRLVIPKQYAERFFPLDPSFADKGLVLSFEDRAGKQWCFRYSYWNSSQSYVMTKGWSRFVKEKQLDAGDTVSFFRARTGEAEQRRLFIDLQHRKPSLPHPFAQFSAAGRPIGPWGGLITSPSVYGAVDLADGRSSLPCFFHRSAGTMPHVGVQAAPSRDDMVGVPMVLDSVPVVFGGGAKPKRVRLFGVNLECPEADGSSNSQLLPSMQPMPLCQWRTGGDESTDISNKNSMDLHFGWSEKEERRI